MDLQTKQYGFFFFFFLIGHKKSLEFFLAKTLTAKTVPREVNQAAEQGVGRREGTLRKESPLW